MSFAIISLILGVLLVVMALSASLLRPLPVSTSIIYLIVGVALGSQVSGVLEIEFVTDSNVLERITEVAVLVSLFTAGLKLRPTLDTSVWRLPLRLGSLSMLVTIVGVTLVGTLGLGLSLGAAVLLGAVLAPTDPVLASDVQVSHVEDQDNVRFGLTGEAGLNDGTAFPFVMLGLGLLGVHPLGDGGWRWFAVDLIWAVASGVAVGALLGTALGLLVVHLRSRYQHAAGLEEFLTLGLVALSYGSALVIHGYGFLAVFTAGYSLRRVETRATEQALQLGQPLEMPRDDLVDTPEAEDPLGSPPSSPEHMARTVLSFNEQLEHIAEVALVLTVGAVLRPRHFYGDLLWFVPVLLLVIRPLAVWVGLLGSQCSRLQKAYIGWFGIRGIGSLYYLSFALEHGLPDRLGERLSGLTLVTVTASIVLHGISVTPMMRFYASKTNPQQND